MSTSAITSTIIYTAAGGILSGLKNGLSGLLQCFLYKYQLSGIVISPAGGKSHIMNHISSSDTLFIDLDPEIFNSLDDDEKLNAKSNNSSLNVNRTVFQKGREVVRDLVEMINGTSKSIKKICFLTADYRLLKFLGIPTITYTLGSNVYYENLSDISAEKKAEIQKYSDDLKKNKANKLLVYSSLNDLMSFVTSNYGCTLKI